MRFQAVAFDVDGTLYPSSALDAAALPLVVAHPLLFASYGAARRLIRSRQHLGLYRDDPPKDRSAFLGRQAEIAASILGRRHGSRGAEPAAAGRPAARGRDPSEALRRRIEEVVYLGVAELFSRLLPYPGVAPALVRLAAAGLRLAALSDIPPGRKLELFGIAQRFECALCSEDSGFLKPSPEPFRLLTSSLGLEPAEILYVGDSRERDLEGARAAGMAVAMVSRAPVRGADLSFFDWSDLVDFALG